VRACQQHPEGLKAQYPTRVHVEPDATLLIMAQLNGPRKGFCSGPHESNRGGPRYRPLSRRQLAAIRAIKVGRAATHPAEAPMCADRDPRLRALIKNSPCRNCSKSRSRAQESIRNQRTHTANRNDIGFSHLSHITNQHCAYSSPTPLCCSGQCRNPLLR
jgi:hypothetical protein